jgi:putative MATE family efflux protein
MFNGFDMLISKRKGFYKKLFGLALPIALQNLISFSIGLTDTVMIGRLGDNAISGVYMGNQVQMLLQVFSAGVEGAILALSAQYWGKRDAKSVARVAAIGTSFLLAVGVLITLVCSFAPEFIVSLFTNNTQIISTGADYLGVLCLSFGFFCLTQSLVAAMRSVELTRIGFYASLVALIVNGVLDYALIFGRLGAPRLEIRGAAIATLSARAVESLIMIIYVFFRNKRLKIKIRDFFKPEKKLLCNFIKHGSPIIAGQVIWAVNILFSTAIIGFSNAEGALTALSIANTLNNLSYVITNGISGALGIMVGKAVGEKDFERVRAYSKTAQLLFIIFGVITGLGIQLAKTPFISLYKISAEAVKEASRFINVLSVTALGTCYQSVCLFGLLKSGGDMKFVFKVEACAVFLAVIPLSLVALHLELAPPMIFICLKCDQFLKCIPAAIRVNKYKWIKNIAAPV